MVMKTSRDPDLLNYIYETGHEELLSNGPNCHQCMNELFQEKKLRDVQTVFVLTPKGPVAFLIGSLKFTYGRETPFTMTAIAQDFLVLRCTLCAQKSVRSQLEETKKEINDATVKPANRKRGTDDCSSEEASDVPTSYSSCKKAKATTEKMTAKEPTTLKKVECLIIDSSARKQACYAMDFELNEHSFGSLKDFGEGSMNFKSVLDQFSYIGKIEFISVLLDKETYKVLMESNAEIGYLTVIDSILDFDVNDFILLCQRFKGSSFKCKFSESNPIWSDEILAKVLPFTSIDIPVVSETAAMEQSAQLVTDKTLAALVDGEKLPHAFNIGNTYNSFTIKAIIKILMTLRDRGKINNYLNWNLGILPSDQLDEAARLSDENDWPNSRFKMTSNRGYAEAEITYEMMMKSSRDPDLLNYIYETGHEELLSNGPNCHQCMNELFQEKKLRDVQTVFVLTPKGPVAFLIGSLKFTYGRETPFTMTAIAQNFLVLRCTLCAQKSVRSQLEETKKEINDATVKPANRKRGTDDCSSEEASDLLTSYSSCKKAKTTTEKMTAKEPTTLKKVECLIIDSSARNQSCYAMDFELNEHSFGSLKDFGEGSMNFKSVLDQFSYIRKIEFNSVLLDKETYKVLMESNAEIGYLTVIDSILDFDVNHFILLCQRFKGSSFKCKFSESNQIWSDEILTKILPFTSIRIPLVCQRAAMEQSAQLITDKTLDSLVDGGKFPQVFDIGNICNSFSIKAIVKILMTLRDRGKINNYLNWNLGILPSDQFYKAARLYDENDWPNSGFKMTCYRGYKDKAEITYEIAVSSCSHCFVRFRIRQ